MLLRMFMYLPVLTKFSKFAFDRDIEPAKGRLMIKL